MKKIVPEDYAKVAAWLKKQKPDAAEDEKSAEPLAHKGFVAPANVAPDSSWAHKGRLRFLDGTMQVYSHGRWNNVIKEVKTAPDQQKAAPVLL